MFISGHHYVSSISQAWVLVNIGFSLSFFCNCTDYCLPALCEVGGLVGVWSAALWDVSWPGKSYRPVLAATSSCLSNCWLLCFKAP